MMYWILLLAAVTWADLNTALMIVTGIWTPYEVLLTVPIAVIGTAYLFAHRHEWRR